MIVPGWRERLAGTAACLPRGHSPGDGGRAGGGGRGGGSCASAGRAEGDAWPGGCHARLEAGFVPMGA